VVVLEGVRMADRSAGSTKPGRARKKRPCQGFSSERTGAILPPEKKIGSFAEETMGGGMFLSRGANLITKPRPTEEKTVAREDVKYPPVM